MFVLFLAALSWSARSWRVKRSRSSATTWWWVVRLSAKLHVLSVIVSLSPTKTTNQLFVSRLMLLSPCRVRFPFSLKMECDKLASEKTEMQRHYVMVSWLHGPTGSGGGHSDCVSLLSGERTHSIFGGPACALENSPFSSSEWENNHSKYLSKAHYLQVPRYQFYLLNTNTAYRNWHRAVSITLFSYLQNICVFISPLYNYWYYYRWYLQAKTIFMMTMWSLDVLNSTM